MKKEWIMFNRFKSSNKSVFSPLKKLPLQQQKEEKTLSFSQRLAKIGHNENQIPDYFLDPVSYTIMNNPVMVNKKDTNTYDAALLDRSCTQSSLGLLDPKRMPIETISPNHTRIEQIHIFLSLLETIHQLQQQLTKKPNNHQFKLDLVSELKKFISFVEEIVNKAEGGEKETKSEIGRVTADKVILLAKLEKELAHQQLSKIRNSLTPSFNLFSYLKNTMPITQDMVVENNTRFEL